jgi:hypothetical protein
VTEVLERLRLLWTLPVDARDNAAFLLRGRHASPFVSPLGTVAPTHRDIEVRTIDRAHRHRRQNLRAVGRLR